MNRFIKIFTAAVLALVAVGLNAQDTKAKAILDELSEKTRKYPTVTSNFSFTLIDKAADIEQVQEGKLKMKGKKYFIQLGENQIFSDGDTRWTYNEEMNEVYIDYAETGEDGGLNPSEIYTIWEEGFKQYYNGEESLNGKIHDVIKLVPEDPSDKTYHSVLVYVNRSKMEVSRIEIKGKQGDDYTYQVKTFDTSASYGDETFVFDPADFPGVDQIDNR